MKRKRGRRQLIQRAAVRKAIRRARTALSILGEVRGRGFADDLIIGDEDKNRLNLFARGMRYGISVVENTLED